MVYDKREDSAKKSKVATLKLIIFTAAHEVGAPPVVSIQRCVR